MRKWYTPFLSAALMATLFFGGSSCNKQSKVSEVEPSGIKRESEKELSDVINSLNLAFKSAMPSKIILDKASSTIFFDNYKVLFNAESNVTSIMPNNKETLIKHELEDRDNNGQIDYFKVRLSHADYVFTLGEDKQFRKDGPLFHKTNGGYTQNNTSTTLVNPFEISVFEKIYDMVRSQQFPAVDVNNLMKTGRAKRNPLRDHRFTIFPGVGYVRAIEESELSENKTIMEIYDYNQDGLLDEIMVESSNNFYNLIRINGDSFLLRKFESDKELKSTDFSSTFMISHSKLLRFEQFLYSNEATSDATENFNNDFFQTPGKESLLHYGLDFFLDSAHIDYNSNSRILTLSKTLFNETDNFQYTVTSTVQKVGRKEYAITVDHQRTDDSCSHSTSMHLRILEPAGLPSSYFLEIETSENSQPLEEYILIRSSETTGVLISDSQRNTFNTKNFLSDLSFMLDLYETY